MVSQRIINDLFTPRATNEEPRTVEVRGDYIKQQLRKAARGDRVMEKTKWDLNSIQFPRLLAELRAVGLTAQQYADLCESMELESSDIDELLERAEEEWEVLKDAHAEDFYAHLFALAKQLGALSLAINVDTRCDAILTFHDGSIRNYAYRDGKWVSAFEMKFEMKR